MTSLTLSLIFSYNFIFFVLFWRGFASTNGVNFSSVLPQETEFCNKYIRVLNYNCTEYSVTTDDGFVLRLQRIAANNVTDDTKSINEKSDGVSRTNRKGTQVPLLLDHAMFLGGEVWFNLLTDKKNDKDLPFFLAKNGFDVWISNHRGTRYSYENVYHANNTREFWDWSFDELASYDLPAMVELIQRETQSQKVHVVGFNQGGMLPLILASTNPTMAAAMESLVLIAPTVYFINITSPTIYNWGNRFTPDQLIYLLNIDNIKYNFTIVEQFLGLFSNFDLNVASYIAVGENSNELISNVTGPNCCLEKPAIVALDRTDSNWIVGSYRHLMHYQQEIRAQQFQKFDFSNALSNYAAYSNTSPPTYNPGLVPSNIPIMVVNGGNDWWADKKNINHLLAGLKGEVNHLCIPKYAHLDMIFSKSVDEDAFVHIVKYLKEGYKSH